MALHTRCLAMAPAARSGFGRPCTHATPRSPGAHPAGARVVILRYTRHYDESLFPDPHAFRYSRRARLGCTAFPSLCLPLGECSSTRRVSARVLDAAACLPPARAPQAGAVARGEEDRHPQRLLPVRQRAIFMQVWSVPRTGETSRASQTFQAFLSIPGHCGRV